MAPAAQASVPAPTEAIPVAASGGPPRLGLSATIEKLAPTRDERLFLVLSIFIGVLSGLLVVAFRIAIEWIRLLTLGSAPHAGQFRLLFVPAVAGLVVSALVIWFFPAARGSGVNQTKAALYVYEGYISFRTVIGKFLTSALAIGGGSFSGARRSVSADWGWRRIDHRAAICDSPGAGCACLRRSAPRPVWPLLSMPLSPPFCS